MFFSCSLIKENLKGDVQSSSGMQITIRKGPDDQTERVVNSDNIDFKWNRVRFGDKKYIKLQCPHCETICVTFNVSKRKILIECISNYILTKRKERLDYFFKILSFLGIWFSFSKRGSYSRNKKGKATPPKRPSNDEKETKGGAKGIGRRISKGK